MVSVITRMNIAQARVLDDMIAKMLLALLSRDIVLRELR